MLKPLVAIDTGNRTLLKKSFTLRLINARDIQKTAFFVYICSNMLRLLDFNIELFFFALKTIDCFISCGVSSYTFVLYPLKKKVF